MDVQVAVCPALQKKAIKHEESLDSDWITPYDFVADTES